MYTNRAQTRARIPHLFGAHIGTVTEDLEDSIAKRNALNSEPFNFARKHSAGRPGANSCQQEAEHDSLSAS